MDPTSKRDLDLEKVDVLYVKVSTSKGIMRFGKKGKLSPRLSGPFKILDRVGVVAYRLATIEIAFHSQSFPCF